MKPQENPLNTASNLPSPIGKAELSQEEINAAFEANGGLPKVRDTSGITGRPSTYKPEYCQALIQFFDVEPFRQVPETWYNPDGTVKREAMKLVPNPPAHFSGFARKLGIATATFYEWTRIYPDFASAYTQAREIRKAQIVDNGLTGLYNPLFAKFAAQNFFGWHDKQEVNHSGEVKSTIVRYSKPDREEPDA